jgi:purine nucleosidase/pyrimidine-specific ribonucleoside hydrolase
MSAKIAVVIDTDPGLDDALAIFLACASPKLDVIGVVSVAGNIGLERVTRNALRLLDFIGRSGVRVIAGAARPIKREPILAADIHGADGLGGVALPASKREALDSDATAFLEAELMRRPPQSLSILALGPLTNIAKLIEARPAAVARLAGIVAMGGAVRERGNVTPFAEFNIAADPEAADIVLRAGIKLTLVPLDVTRKVTVDRAFCARLVAEGGATARASAAMIEAYLRNIAERHKAKGAPTAPSPQPTFPLHDPCVMLHAIDPALFQVERLPIKVIVDKSERDGQTVIDQKAGTEIEVLTGANTDQARALVFELLRGLP